MILFLSIQIKNSKLKEIEFHFQIEWVQSISKNSEKFDITVQLKNLGKNGAGIIGNNISQKNVGSGREKLSGHGVRRKSARPKFIFVQWSQ